jgi:hypothetical protein
MAEARFDPGGYYHFDLAQGAVKTRDGARVLVLSDTALAPLVSGAAERGDFSALTKLGKSIGAAAKQSLGKEPLELSPETVLAHAAGALALFGWGHLGLERWGDALVATVSGAPTFANADEAVGALLSGMFSEMGGLSSSCVPAGGGRFIIVDPGIADGVREWVRSGADVAAIVSRLGVA